MADREKTFFANCRKYKPADREEEFQKIKREYAKVVEDSSEKIQNAEESYNLVDRYLRKLDQELHKFKMELEADNRGITEILEKRSLEMDAPSAANAKENFNTMDTKERKCIIGMPSDRLGQKSAPPYGMNYRW